jgi:hypothetical protein
MVLPDDMEQLTAYLRANDYQWGYQAVKHVDGPPSPGQLLPGLVHAGPLYGRL